MQADQFFIPQQDLIRRAFHLNLALIHDQHMIALGHFFNVVGNRDDCQLRFFMELTDHAVDFILARCV